jgi:hypothetical protein
MGFPAKVLHKFGNIELMSLVNFLPWTRIMQRDPKTNEKKMTSGEFHAKYRSSRNELWIERWNAKLQQLHETGSERMKKEELNHEILYAFSYIYIWGFWGSLIPRGSCAIWCVGSSVRTFSNEELSVKHNSQIHIPTWISNQIKATEPFSYYITDSLINMRDENRSIYVLRRKVPYNVILPSISRANSENWV